MATEEQFEAFVNNNGPQLATIPRPLWKSLFIKLKNEIFDAGSYFAFVPSERRYRRYGLQLQREDGLAAESAIFLLDHSWTFAPQHAKQVLSESPQLLERLENLMALKEEATDEKATEEGENVGIPDEWTDTVDLISNQTKATKEAAWEALQNSDYQMIDAISKLTMEDHGTSDQMRALQEQIAGGITAPEKKPAVPAPKTKAERINAVMNMIWKYCQTYQATWRESDGVTKSAAVWYLLDEVGSAILHDDDPNVQVVPFLYTTPEGIIPYSVTWPIKDLANGALLTRDYVPAGVDGIERTAYLNAFFPTGEHNLVQAYEDMLKQQGSFMTPFTFASTDSSWDSVSAAMKQSQEVLQLDIISLKDALKAVRACYGASAKWFAEAFVLLTDLPVFVGAHLYAQELKKNRHWFVMSEPLLGEMREFITTNLAEVVRQRDLPDAGLVRRYIHRPALYGGRKFAVDYTILLWSSGEEVQLYRHKDFVTRLARDEFDLKDLDNRNRHFALPRFDASGKRSPDVPTFVKNIEKSLSGRSWESVQKYTDEALKAVFAARLAAVGLKKDKPWFAVHQVSVEFTDAFKPVITDIVTGSELLGINDWGGELARREIEDKKGDFVRL